MKDLIKLILGGLIIGLFFSLIVIWVFYVWQFMLIPK